MEEEKLENKNIVTETENKILDTEAGKIENKTTETSEKEIPEIKEEIKQEIKQEAKTEDFVAPIEKGRFSGLKTFSQDVAKAVEKNEGTIVRELLEEQAERDIEEKEFSPESKKNKFFVFAGIGLFILALIFLIIVFFTKTNFFAKDIVLNNAPFIFVEDNSFLDISNLRKEDIYKKVFDFSKSANFKAGGIMSVYLTKNNKVIGFQDLMQNIESSVKKEYFEIISNSFMVGIMDTRNEKIVRAVGGDMFFLLRVRSFADAFPIMKDWERRMFLEFAPFWGIYPNRDNAYLLTKDFEDGFIANKNARILKDINDQIILTYVFLDDNYVLLSNNNKTTNEIIERISAGKIRK